MTNVLISIGLLCAWVVITVLQVEVRRLKRRLEALERNQQ